MRDAKGSATDHWFLLQITPLLLATRTNAFDMVEMLIDNKAQQPESLWDIECPLHAAIALGHDAIAKVLAAHHTGIFT